MPKIQSFPRAVSLTRLKTNLFFLFLSVVFKTIFTPYRSIKRGLIWMIDDHLDTGFTQTVIGFIEYGVFGVLLINVLQAIWSLLFPSPVVIKQGDVGRSITPSKPSSPLTRPYPPLPSRSETSTPTQNQKPATQSTTSLSLLQTPSKIASTPTRSSPLNPSTARLLGLSPTPTKPFYYEMVKKENGEEEIRVSSPLKHSSGMGMGSGIQGDLVFVEGEEREWVDNAWKGVRGKGGRVGL